MTTSLSYLSTWPILQFCQMPLLCAFWDSFLPPSNGKVINSEKLKAYYDFFKLIFSENLHQTMAIMSLLCAARFVFFWWHFFFDRVGSLLLCADFLYLQRVGLVAPQHMESSWTRNQIHVSCMAGRFLTTGPPGKSLMILK